MARRALLPAQQAYLLDGTAGACAYGPIAWRSVNGAYSGDVPVAVEALPDHEVVLSFQYRPMRPTEPSVLLLVDGECLARLDVNGGHQGRTYSHWHRPKFSGIGEIVDPVPAWVECPPLDEELDVTIMPRLLKAAARLFNVDASAVDWEYPPGGGSES